MIRPLRSIPGEVLPDDVAEPELAALDALRTRLAAVRLLAHGDDRERRRRFRLALAIALLVHGLLYVGVRQWSLLHDEVASESEVIHLRLIDPQAQAPEVPGPPSIERPVEVSSPDRVEVSVPATAAPRRPQEPGPVATAPVRDLRDVAPDVDRQPTPALFDRNARVVLPAPPDPDPARFGSREHKPGYAPDPMVHTSPLPYKPTVFDRYWTPEGETLLGEWVRKASKESSYDTKHGTRITCKAFLFLMACGWGPTPRVSIDELRAMRVDPPGPRDTVDDPYLPPVP